MNKKLHILFLSSWYPSRVSPYNGDFIQRHAEAVALKNQVTVIHVISDNELQKLYEVEEFYKDGVRTLIGYIKTTNNPIFKIFLFIKAYLKLYKKTGLIDIVHLNVIYPAGLFALYLKWIKRKPFIISEHWSVYHELDTKIHLFKKLIFKVITKNSSFISPVSYNLADSMKAIGLKGIYKCVPNVVNTDIFTPSSYKSTDFTLLHVSNMADVKNVPLILNVIKKLELLSYTFTFYLVGENVEKYSSLIEKLAIKQIKISNHITQTELSSIINKSTALILFSKTENLPCVVLEAFSCGTPVISSNVGGIQEYFPENYGKLINSKEDELLEAIIDLKNNFKKASDKEMHNYVVENFSPEAICNKFSILYNNSI